MRTTVLFLLLTFSLNAQTLNELFTQSNAAFANKDYKLFLELNQQMDSMRPMHPRISYNLASAYAANGDMQNTYEVLKRIAVMDNTVDIAADENFTAFRETAYYGEWLAFREQMGKEMSQSNKVVTLDEKDLHPEGLCYVEGTGWLAASVHKRKIVSFDITTGKCADWLSGNDMLAVFAIKPDSNNKYLWAATSAIPEMQGYTASQEGTAEILKIDIATKQIVKRFPMEGGHLFGDLLVLESGDVLISDSGTPVIYRIKKDVMEEWLDLRKEAFSLQGITANEKNETLYIADYLKGILVISLKDKSRYWLELPCTKGIDGLTYHPACLLAIHNGTKPIRIIEYHLMKDDKMKPEYHLWDSNRAEFNEPVLGTMHKGDFYFFANAPWKAYDKFGNLIDGAYSSPELYRLSPE